MKTVKPLSLSALHRVVEYGGRFHFAVTAVALVDLLGDPSPLLEVELWKTVAKELGDGVALDEAMPKSRGEVLVTGSAHAPGAVPAVAVDVRVALGPVDKTLRVIGDRAWDARGVASPPAPFTSMPLGYARAFGGDGYAPNPLGRGFAPVEGLGGRVHPLPNVEDPRAMVRSPNDRPPPAGFGPYDFAWPQRQSKLGTYDQRWLREDYPGFPRDVDWTAFNAAPDDQQVEGFFRGDEPFALANLHPERPRIEGRLPGLAARAFITRGGSFEEVGLRLDTVHFLPGALRAVLLYRGVAYVAEDDAADVEHLLLACERLGEPRPAEHYRAVLAQRTDPARGARYAFRERDLTPPGSRSGLDALESDGDGPRNEGLLQARARVRAEAELQRSRANLARFGVDPDALLPRSLPEPEPPPALEDLPEAIERATAEAEARRAESERKREEAVANAKALCARHGLDFEAMVAAAKRQEGGPPRGSIDDRLGGLRQAVAAARAAGIDVSAAEAKLADPGLRERLAAASAQELAAYRKTAHHRAPAAPLDEATRAHARRVVTERYAARQGFAGWDLTGVDLSSMYLPGADFREALMEGAILRGAELAGADFSGAVLARADLSGAGLSGASLRGANLGSAVLRGVRAEEPPDLSDATLWGADLAGALLRGVTLSGATVFEASLAGADLGGLKARKALFYKVDLAGAGIAGAELQGAAFLECSVEGADLTGAKLRGAAFLKARGDGAVFRGAEAGNLRVVDGSSFARADFQEAVLTGSTLRGTRFAGAKFSRAECGAADFSECDLTGAEFYRAALREARFVRSDLTGAVMVAAGLLGALLQKATLEGADLTDAVLFGADMARVKGTPRSLEGALLERVRVIGAPG